MRSKKNNFDVTVYERDDTPRVVGAGVVLWPNASCILDKLGLLSLVTKKCLTLSTLKTFNQHGDLLSNHNIHLLSSAFDGYASYSISRFELHTNLLSICHQLNIPINFGFKAKKIESSAVNSTTFFDNGEIATADLTIGADGRMKSIARKFVIGNNHPRYLNYINWVGLSDRPHSGYTDDTINDYWGDGERFAMVPLSNGKLYWAGSKVLPQNLGEPHGGNKTKLKEIFQDWPQPIADIIELTDESAINRIEVYDHDPIEKWSNKRVTLLGDSAHAAAPTSGQGACQAIEDAYFIAKCLSTNSSIDNALLMYERIRKEKTKKIILTARESVNNIFHTPRTPCVNTNPDSDQSSTENFLTNAVSLWRLEDL